MHNTILSSVPHRAHSHKMHLFKFVVLAIYTMPNLYSKLTAFEVIQLASQADDIMSMAVQWQK